MVAHFCKSVIAMGSILSRSRAVTAAVLKARWALVKVLVAFPFPGVLLLPIGGFDDVGKLLKKRDDR